MTSLRHALHRHASSQLGLDSMQLLRGRAGEEDPGDQGGGEEVGQVGQVERDKDGRDAEACRLSKRQHWVGKHPQDAEGGAVEAAMIEYEDLFAMCDILTYGLTRPMT